MNEQYLSRRQFMKAVGVTSVASALGDGTVFSQAPAAAGAAPARAASPKVPTRPFGKTGVRVSALALGGIFDIVANQLVLQRALDFGVTYWDTASGYTNGNSELGIGMFFEKHPEVRKQIFLVSKAGGPHTPAGLTSLLEQSLQRLKTDHIDLYFLHGVPGGEAFTPEIKAWAAKAKAANKIKFFGFSTHGNMESTLQAAARTGWIDGLMLRYDYRLMQTDAMRAAMDACANAGIGLTAMKTQAGGPFRANNEADAKLGGHFLQRGFTTQQAKVKAVWENPQVAAICSQMASIGVLESNVAAALDKTKLTSADHAALRLHASETRGQYCAGCRNLCEGAIGGRVPIGDVMRCLMYHHTYGDRALALEVFGKLPDAARANLADLDYTSAERLCPNRLSIARLMREAKALLA